MKAQLRLLAGAHPMSRQSFERVLGLRRLVCDSDDDLQGVHAFLDKRKPVFQGR
jgi:methylmalonyl-CoA decarboxylase